MFKYLIKHITFPLYYKQRGIPLLRALGELEVSQWYGQEKLRQLQWNKFKAMLKHAYLNTSYYNNLLNKNSLSLESIKTWDDFRKIPILDKQVAKANIEALISRKASKRLCFRSSGSSGWPMTIYKDEHALGFQRAAKWRGRSWNGIDIGSRILQIWGVDKNRTFQDALEDRLIENKSFFVVQEINHKTIKKHLDKYHKMKPDLLYGYAHSLYEFAYLIKESKLAVKHTPRLIVASSEVLWDYQKHLIEQVLGTKVRNEYGCKEFHLIAFECPYGNMHISQENLIVEFINNGKIAQDGELADIVITDLTNYEMPLIRYRLGDRGSFKNIDCACGRGLMVMDIKIGRDDDMVILPNNIRIYASIFSIPHNMPFYDEVRAFKVVQRTFTDFEILIDASNNARSYLKQHFNNIINEYIGKNIATKYKFLSPIPKDASGKLKYFLCEIK